MAKNKKSLSEIHALAITRCTNITEVLYQERQSNCDDRRFAFVAGAQWESLLNGAFENKLRMEVNKLPQAIERVYTQWCQNSVDVKFVPKNGTKGDALSDLCQKLYRASETDSNAQDAYRNSFRDALAGGFSAFRLSNEYIDESDCDNDEQKITWHPIKDADTSVFFDLSCKLQDKSDAKYAFVLAFLTNEEYEERFGRPVSSFPKDIRQSAFDWYTPTGVYIAEYFVKEEVSDWKITYETMVGDEVVKLSELDDAKMQELDAIGATEISRRKFTKCKVRKYILDGNCVLEDCGYIAGTEIPIIPVYGHVTYIDNVERCTGMVRPVKDIQRLKNMQVSKLAEIASLSSHSKPVFTPQQISGHQQMWAEDNIKNYPYLTINPTMDQNGNVVPAPPVMYTQPPVVPAAIETLLNVTEMDIQDALGKPMTMLTPAPNTSGYAMEIQQQAVESPNYIYLDNFRQAIKRCGQIWLSMAKDVYSSNRKVKLLDKGGKASVAELMQLNLDDGGSVYYANDLSKANLDVMVDVGASTSTQRQAILRNIIPMLGLVSDESAKMVLMSTALMNIEGEGMGNIREYFRTQLVKLGVEKPTEEDLAAAANQTEQPNAEQNYLVALAEAEMSKSTKYRADSMVALAKAEKTEAETLEIMMSISDQPFEQIQELVEEKRQPFNPNPSEPYYDGSDVLDFYEAAKVENPEIAQELDAPSINDLLPPGEV